MDIKSLKIGICGCGGTGKTSLAESLSKFLDVPLLRAKDITQTILKRDGYDYSSGVQIERFLANTGRQKEMLEKTLEQQSIDSFVTDRTVIDLAAYALCEIHDDRDTVHHIVETCKYNVKIYTHLILCPWQNSILENNDKRTLNPWYQLTIHAIERGIMADWGCKYFIVNSVGNESRTEEVLDFLRKG